MTGSSSTYFVHLLTYVYTTYSYVHLQIGAIQMTLQICAVLFVVLALAHGAIAGEWSDWKDGRATHYVSRPQKPARHVDSS